LLDFKRLLIRFDRDGDFTLVVPFRLLLSEYFSCAFVPYLLCLQLFAFEIKETE